MEWVEMDDDHEKTDLGRDMYNEHPLTDQKRAIKRQAIESAVQHQDMPTLQMLATSRDGLIANDLRREAWPVLTGASPPWQDLGNWKELPEHPEEAQIKLDVDRTFTYANHETDKEDLLDLIRIVLRKNPKLSYYQGYHDIAQIVLIVFNNKPLNAAPFLEHITLHFLRDFMVPSLHASLDHLQVIPPLLMLADPYVGDIVRNIEPFYALSSIITLFAHHIRDFDAVCTLFDFVFASDMSMALYLYAALVKLRKRDIKQVSDDMDEVHSVMSSLADKDVNVFDLTNGAGKLRDSVQLHDLDAWKAISEKSVLKLQHTKDIDTVLDSQIAETEARAKLEEEEREQLLNKRRAEAEERRRKAAAANSSRVTPLVGLSICVGVLGVMLVYQDHIRGMVNRYV